MRRSSVLFLSRAALLALALVGSACDNGPDASTAPTPVLVTETFTGTVTLNGAVSHGFTVSTGGPTVAEITAIDPAGAFIGFEMGTWSGVVCTAVLSNDAGTVASVLRANTQSSASLCVRMHDPNGILIDTPVTYTVTVVHP
jgi:ABC-type transport system substrate-binding protein